MIASETEFGVVCMTINLNGGGYLSHMPAFFRTAIIKERNGGRSVWYGGSGYKLGKFATGLCGRAVTVDMFTKHARIQLYTDIPSSAEYSSEEIRQAAAWEMKERPYRDIEHFLLRCYH